MEKRWLGWFERLFKMNVSCPQKIWNNAINTQTECYVVLQTCVVPL